MSARRLLGAAVAPALVLSCGQLPAARTAAAPSPSPKPPYAAALSKPRVDPYYPAKGTTTLDALHYGLDLTWDDASRDLSGTATILFRVTRRESSVSLDLDRALHVSSVAVDGTAIPFRHTGNKLAITTGAVARNSRHTVVISYDGTPATAAVPATRKDIPDVGWTTMASGQAWALQEPFGAFTWYPVNDHPSDKAFYDLTVHTKAAWRGISNGKLMRDSVVAGWRTMRWHLASPAASYLITIDIGPYRRTAQVGPHGLPLTYWVRHKDQFGVHFELHHSPAILRWLEARLGPYPFDRLGVVAVPNRTAEETQTMVSIDPKYLDVAGGSILAHEYAHQWYGDEVTPNNWKDLWMNESFAQYIEIRWDIAHNMGTPRSWRRYLDKVDQKLRRKDGPPGEYDRAQFASGTVYLCGARMLDRLHTKLGGKLFWKVLRDWPRQHRYGNADRGEWIRYLDRITGRHLDHFVTKWLTSPKSPK